MFLGQSHKAELLSPKPRIIRRLYFRRFQDGTSNDTEDRQAPAIWQQTTGIGQRNHGFSRSGSRHFIGNLVLAHAAFRKRFSPRVGAVGLPQRLDDDGWPAPPRLLLTSSRSFDQLDYPWKGGCTVWNSFCPCFEVLLTSLGRFSGLMESSWAARLAHGPFLPPQPDASAAAVAGRMRW